MHQEVVGGARLPPRMPTRVDSNGRLRWVPRAGRPPPPPVPLPLPVSSPEWTGETLAEREERRLAEAAVVGPPLPAREPGPAETAAPPPKRPAPPPRPALTRRRRRPRRATPRPRPRPPHTAGKGGSAGEQAGRKRGCDGPCTGRGRLADGRRGSSEDREGCARVCDRGHGRLVGGRRGSEGECGGRERGCGPWHAAQAGEEPRTGRGRLAGGRRSSGSGQGEREVPRPRQPRPHPHQPPQAVPPQALPPGAGAA